MDVLCNLIIRPPRAQYDPNRALPGPAIRIGNTTFHRTDLQLVGSKGHRLECSHYEPDVWLQPALPCVVFLHGNSGCRVDAFDAVRVLLPLNFTVFTLDFAGSGLSEGTYVTLGANECDDVRTVVAHLRSSGRVTKIGLWGRSMGAATALFYGATDPSIAALVLDSPFRKLTDLMMELVAVMSSERRVHVPRPLVLAAVAMVRLAILRRARMDISHLDVTTAAARSFVPALFGHASGDTFIRPSHSQALFDAYPGDKNIIHFDGSHNSPRPQFFYDSVSIFFLNTLHPPQAETDTAQPPLPSPSGRAFVPAELPPPVVALARPADEEVSTLMRMGFPRAAAERALRRYSRNVELAASYLIDHASDGWADLMGDDTTLPGAHVASPRAGGASAAAHAFEVVTPRAEGRAFGDADEGDGPSGEATACAEGQEPGMPSGWVLPADAVSHNSSGGAADDRLARALGLSGPAVQQGEEQRRDSVGGSRPGPGQRETKR